MCWKCKKKIQIVGLVSRTAVCEFCGAELRCCKNCMYYSPGAHYDCHETIEEQVVEKDRANFCEYFELSGLSGQSDSAQAAFDAKKAFNSLFGD